MLSPRGQAVLEAKILSSASSICPWPVLSFYFGLVKMCNAGNFDSQLPIHYRITATIQIPDCHQQ